jgi:hypothetical protein
LLRPRGQLLLLLSQLLGSHLVLHVHTLHVLASLHTLAGRAAHLHVHLLHGVGAIHVLVHIVLCAGLLGRLLLLLLRRLGLYGLNWLCLRGLLLRGLGRRRRRALGLLGRLLILLLGHGARSAGVGHIGIVEGSCGLRLLRRRLSRLVRALARPVVLETDAGKRRRQSGIV